jgi:hypothetical protein
LSEKEALLLFGSHGCGDAQTPIEAAMFIENFVARRKVSGAPSKLREIGVELI